MNSIEVHESVQHKCIARYASSRNEKNRCSMYGIFTYIYHEFMPNVGKYSIHGAFGLYYIYTVYIYTHTLKVP